MLLTSFKYFHLDSFAFIINGLEMLFGDLTVTEITHYYVATTVCAALNSLTVSNTKGNTTGAERHCVIQETSFMFKKKFATTNN